MQAIVFQTYGSEAVLEVANLPRPVPNINQVLIRVAAAGVNPGDIALRSGQFKRLFRLKLPFTPGMEVAGIVEEVGQDVTQFKVGQAVFASLPTQMGGGYAEYAAIDANFVAPLPAKMSMIEAAGTPLAGLTALQALRDKAQIRAGHHILINGASGGVGTFAVQLVKAMGAQVTATCSARNADIVRGLGADAVIDYTQTDITMPNSVYDVVFDAANTFPFPKGLRTLKPEGTLVSVNPILGNPLTNFYAGLRGRAVRSVFVRPDGVDLKTLGNWIDQGKVCAVIDRTYPLSQVAEAHRYSATKRARGKIILIIDETLSNAKMKQFASDGE